VWFFVGVLLGVVVVGVGVVVVVVVAMVVLVVAAATVVVVVVVVVAAVQVVLVVVVPVAAVGACQQYLLQGTNLPRSAVLLQQTSSTQKQGTKTNNARH
jgi:hypothetical protein